MHRNEAAVHSARVIQRAQASSAEERAKVRRGRGRRVNGAGACASHGLTVVCASCLSSCSLLFRVLTLVCGGPGGPGGSGQPRVLDSASSIEIPGTRFFSSSPPWLMAPAVDSFLRATAKHQQQTTTRNKPSFTRDDDGCPPFRRFIPFHPARHRSHPKVSRLEPPFVNGWVSSLSKPHTIASLLCNH